MVLNLPYELHVTVQEGTSSHFIQTCKHLGVKPLLIEAQRGTTMVLHDLQTSSIVKGSWAHVCHELDRIKIGLNMAGFVVTREKVETTSFHPDAPTAENKKPMPSGCYFETHIPVLFNANELLTFNDLQTVADKFGAHLSRNAFKEVENGYIYMITLRDYGMNREAFDWMKNKLEDEVDRTGFFVPSISVIEFACYDSNVSHDSEWLRKGPPSSFNVKQTDIVTQDGVKYSFHKTEFQDRIGSGTKDLG